MAIDPALGVKLVFIFGFLNLIFFLLIYLTCRCTPTRLPKKIVQSSFYQSFFKYHCYFWYLLLASLIAHMVIAYLTFGFPF
ncbi:MAG: hypothetical protein V1702_01595 [Candidatus Woesearchaeota archaeon]